MSLVVKMPKSMEFREWRRAKVCNVLCRDRRKVDADTSKKRKWNCLHDSVYRHVLIFVFAILCGGCAVGPNFSTPIPPVLPHSYVLKGDEPAVPLDTWWQVFADEQLNALISKGYANNLDVRVAYERVIEARSNPRLRSPRCVGNPNVSHPFRFRKTSSDASWQVGLLGKLQRSREAAAAELCFEENEAQFVRQTLLSDIARSYLRVRLLQNQHDLAQQSIAVEEQTAMLVEQRKKAGLSNDLDLAQTRSLQQRIMALQADLRKQLEVELNQLSVLVGEAPSFDMRDYIGFAPIPLIPPMSDVGFPADLLRLRPDVRREESALAAAVARIGIAEADLFRKLPLLGTISAGAQKISGMFQSGLLELGANPTIRRNSARFDRVASDVKIRESQCRQAFHTYQKTVIEAAREVEDALTRHRSYHAQLLLMNQAVSSDEIAVELSLERYDAGKAEFQTFLEARQQLVSDLQNRAQTQADAVEQLIRLYNAVGGSWRPVNVIPIEFNQPINPTEFNQPKIHPTEIHPTEINQREINQREINQLEINQPEFNQPEFNQREINQVEINQPIINQPIINQREINPTKFNPTIFNPVVSQNNAVKSPFRPPVIYITPSSESEKSDQQQSFPRQNFDEQFSPESAEPFVPRKFVPITPFGDPSTEPVPQKSILVQPSNELTLPPLPSPGSFDGFSTIGEEDLFDPPHPKTGFGLPAQKVLEP